MSNPLPHDRYITTVTIALAAANLTPTDWWTSDAEINRYDDGPDAGCTTQLDAYFAWDDEHPALNTEEHKDGIALVWEHPAEQWQWAPRKENGHLVHDPEFLSSLPRWVDPAVVVLVVQELLAGRPAPTAVGPLWLEHEEAQASVDAWDTEEKSGAQVHETGQPS